MGGYDGLAFGGPKGSMRVYIYIYIHLYMINVHNRKVLGIWVKIMAVVHALGKYMVIQNPRLMVAPLNSKEWDTSVYDS